MRNTWISALIEKHASSGVLVDANLLFIRIVAEVDPALVSTLKGTREYSQSDAEMVIEFLNRFHRVYTTPNVLTEVSNLASRCGDRSPLLQAALRSVAREVTSEQFVESPTVVGHACFIRLGLSDAALAHLADQGRLLLTNDLLLSIRLETSGVDCVHYDRDLRPSTF